MSDSLLGLLWRRRQARRRLVAAQEAQADPSGDCVRCGHAQGSHLDRFIAAIGAEHAGCAAADCRCPRYEPPA